MSECHLHIYRQDFLTDEGTVRVPAGFYRAEGIIKNVNTIEKYRALDKASVLNRAGHTVSQSCNPR